MPTSSVPSTGPGPWQELAQQIYWIELSSSLELIFLCNESTEKYCCTLLSSNSGRKIKWLLILTNWLAWLILKKGISCRIQKKPQSQFIKELQSSVFQTAYFNPLVRQEINLYQFSQEIHHLGKRVKRALKKILTVTMYPQGINELFYFCYSHTCRM